MTRGGADLSRLAVIFDLDGTLADTAPDLAAPIHAMRAEQGLAPLHDHDLRPFASTGARGLIGRGLDVSVQARLLDLIRSLSRDLGLSAIVVTHDLAVARLLAHRIAVMRGGAIVEEGLADRVLDDPRHPYTQLLVSSVLPP